MPQCEHVDGIGKIPLIWIVSFECNMVDQKTAYQTLNIYKDFTPFSWPFSTRQAIISVTENNHAMNMPASKQPSPDENREIRNIRSLLHRDPHNLAAWIKLADLLEDPQQKQACLAWAAKINPDDQAIRARLAELLNTAAAAPAQNEAPEMHVSAGELAASRAVTAPLAPLPHSLDPDGAEAEPAAPQASVQEQAQVLSPQPRYCPFCGQPNPQDFFFCTWCGERFPQSTLSAGRVTKPLPELSDTEEEIGKP